MRKKIRTIMKTIMITKTKMGKKGNEKENEDGETRIMVCPISPFNFSKINPLGVLNLYLFPKKIRIVWRFSFPHETKKKSDFSILQPIILLHITRFPTRGTALCLKTLTQSPLVRAREFSHFGLINSSPTNLNPIFLPHTKLTFTGQKTNRPGNNAQSRSK